jgi:negative regulator of sigma-B (phosphoserine phosphatase)
MEALSLEWGQAGHPLHGQEKSGDACCVVPFEGGLAVAVVDALGHGPGAAETASQAVAAFKACAGFTLAELFQHCHKALQKTRGVAMSTAIYRESGGILSWAGVGNVEALMLRGVAQAGAARERLLLKGGVVGYQLPTLRTSVFSPQPGDTLVFATDGVKRSFIEGADWRFHSAQELAESILARFDSGMDDALVWAGRFKEAA